MYPSLLIIFILRLFKSNNFPTSYLSFLLITILLPTFFFLFSFTFSLLPPSPFVLFQCYNFSSSFLMRCLCDLLLFLLLLTFLCTCLFLFPPNLIFLCFRFSMTVIQCDFFSLVPPNFCTKKKTASQPIRAAVPVNPVTKKGRDWLLGGFSFWY